MIRLYIFLLLPLLMWGCASVQPQASSRPFVFKQDTFAFANETVWDYRTDPATGKTTHTRRDPPPSYSLHCFVLARSACQFFRFARFDPAQPVADEKTYRELIRRVVATDPKRRLDEKQKIVFPGYNNLYNFSAAWEHLLKSNCGRAWQSYFQRGHWRMVFPFSREHQTRMAQALIHSLQQNFPPVVHVVRFPKITINHAILLFAVEEDAAKIQFTAYDPNSPSEPIKVAYDRDKRSFFMLPNDYFAGGRVDVYQVYCRWDY